MADAVIITRGSTGNLARRRRAVYEGVGWIYHDKVADKRAVVNFTTQGGKGGLSKGQLRPNRRGQIVSAQRSEDALARHAGDEGAWRKT